MSPQMRRIVDRIRALQPRSSDGETAMRSQMQRVRHRMSSGVDVYGQPFLPKADGTPSRLYRTGRLYASLTVTNTLVDGDMRCWMGVVGPARAYAPHVNLKRRFLGASLDDRMRIIDDIRQERLDRIRGI